MEIVEHLDDQVKIEIKPDLPHGSLTVTSVTGDILVEMDISGDTSLYVPYGAVVEAEYSENNRTVLYVPGKTPDGIRTATTRRFPNMSVGV